MLKYGEKCALICLNMLKICIYEQHLQKYALNRLGRCHVTKFLRTNRCHVARFCMKQIYIKLPS